MVMTSCFTSTSFSFVFEFSRVCGVLRNSNLVMSGGVRTALSALDFCEPRSYLSSCVCLIC